jgi:hydroxyethylthiazole kinase-like uncharacterized protein yjeF
MKILSADQIRNLDAYTIKNEPVASIDLMERAANSFTEWFTGKFTSKNKTAIVCGTGNNGGDGLAIARMLLNQKYEVAVYVVKPKEETSEDFAKNEEKLKGLTNIYYIREASDIPDLKDNDIIIDGLFGSGLSRPVKQGIFKEVIEAINSYNCTKVAIDIPSGLFADQYTTGDIIIKADFTVSFQTVKLTFLLPENHIYVGDWNIVDIGLDKEYIERLEVKNFLLEERHIASIYKKRQPFSHKGDFGKCLLISGSFGKMGAAVLAATAALRSGVGLLTIHAPRCGYSILQLAAPEAMVSPDDDEKYFSSLPEIEGYDALGIGPGLGTDDLQLNAFAELLSLWKKPMVIDADGLNLLAKNHHLMDMVPANSILTPHPKEFERLAGKTSNHFERLERLREFAGKHEVYVLLKGYHTAITTPAGKVYFNRTGNPGMATGGTGDVLTGILSALLAQQYSPEEAVLFGAWLHGLAGDLAAKDVGEESIIASDVVKYLSSAYHHLTGVKHNNK